MFRITNLNRYVFNYKVKATNTSSLFKKVVPPQSKINKSSDETDKKIKIKDKQETTSTTNTNATKNIKSIIVSLPPLNKSSENWKDKIYYTNENGEEEEIKEINETEQKDDKFQFESKKEEKEEIVEIVETEETKESLKANVENKDKSNLKLLRIKNNNNNNVKKEKEIQLATIEEKEKAEEGNQQTISTVLKGTQYEIKTIEILNSFGMNLIRSGGKDDKGIDFIGNWELSDKNINIIGQCKNYNKKVGPSALREFESTLTHYKIQFDKDNLKSIIKDTSSTLGIVTSISGFSPSIKSFVEEIQHPVIISHLKPDGIFSFHLNSNAKLLLPNLLTARRKLNNNNSIDTTNQFTLDLIYLNKN